MHTLKLDGATVSLGDLRRFIDEDITVATTDEARARVAASARFCAKIAQKDEAHYGINTGFGVLANKRIAKGSQAALQKNLLRSHATGMGDDLSEDIVRLMMVLRVNSLLRGYSGISLQLIDRLLLFINNGVVPAVPMYGSVGASGDLAPLAHMSLSLIGEGTVYLHGQRVTAAEAHASLALEPLELGPKEGLALINGTQLMSAYAVREALRTQQLLKTAVIAASLSIEAYEATDRVFDARIHALKNHPGEMRVAAAFRQVLADSEIVASHRNCDKVQDPYSFRCAPQVLGAVLDTLLWVEEWVTREINAVTDNPLLFMDDGDVISGGNFHGEHMAIALDALAIAAAEVGSISERRVDKLIDNDSDKLPQFLTPDPGLNSGLMVSQYLAASLVSENKIHAHPATVDSIPTSANFEDHVSMGSIGALKLARVLDNVSRILTVELLAGSQAMEYFRPMKGGRGSEVAYTFIRDRVPFIKEDVIVADYLRTLQVVVDDGSLVAAVENALGAGLLESGEGL